MRRPVLESLSLPAIKKGPLLELKTPAHRIARRWEAFQTGYLSFSAVIHRQLLAVQGSPNARSQKVSP
jgi:hypothetical protein